VVRAAGLDIECIRRRPHDVLCLSRNEENGASRLPDTTLLRTSLDVTSAPSTQQAAQPSADAVLDGLIREGGIRSLYQPIVELDSGRVVGYEALARGPAGTRLEAPKDLFATARSVDRVEDLDWACRRAALGGALEGNLRAPLTLFANVEPEAVGAPPPPELTALYERAEGSLRVVVEITERALAAKPAELLRTVERVRRRGWAIALDDVGADRYSLALMPFLKPDVVKLDLRLIQDRPSTEIAEVVNAVNAEVERTGGSVLAEGIEHEEHLATAIAMGATLGQGWLFGRPGPLPQGPAPTGRAVPFLEGRQEQPESTPGQVAKRSRPARVATKRHLVAVSRHLEDQAETFGETAVLLSSFQTGARFSPATRRRYEELAERAAFVAAFGLEMGEEPAPGVRGATIEREDPLVDEWGVAVVAPHFAAVLAACDLGDDGPDLERRFEFVVTYDRDLVLEAASLLMARISPILAL